MAAARPWRRAASAAPAVALSLAAALVLGTIAWAVLVDKEPSTCQMTFMSPRYSRIDVSASTYGDKYALLRYEENGVQPSPGEHWPVLFIPGSAGSPRQVRSLAAEAARAGLPLDFYTIDAEEEFTGLYGVSIMEQAVYANDVIGLLLREYYPNAGHVIIIGHSMGGIVARALFTLPNYAIGSVRSIITLATPHAAPPYNIEWPLFKCVLRSHCKLSRTFADRTAAALFSSQCLQ